MVEIAATTSLTPPEQAIAAQRDCDDDESHQNTEKRSLDLSQRSLFQISPT
jgi:hypothetical protein